MDAAPGLEARAQLLCDRGMALHEAGRAEEALALFSEAVRLLPRSPRAHFYKGFMLMLLGRWDEGWPELGWRAKSERALPGPEWDGGALGGRRLMLWAEQGLGDTIQMLRYIPRAARRGGPVALAATAPLVRLLEGFPGLEGVHGPGDHLRYDVQAPLFALPRLFATTPATVPPPVPLRPAQLTEAARRIKAAGGRKVGLVWAGNPRHPNDARRSCGLAALASLFGGAGIAWFALQQERAADEPRIAALGPFADLAETAAAVAALDLVIAVDTAVAHLAGTMGKPCWLLLPYAADWRWLRARSDTPWYPTMRLFRQARPGDWAGVAARVASALARRRLTGTARPAHLVRN